MGSHESSNMGKDEWLTPPGLISVLGPFDLDPCSPGERRPWDTAANHYALPDDGLSLPWYGRVWLNPPYGRDTGKWLARLAEHGNGIALIFARTETETFFENVWNKADALLFFRGRIAFHHVNGQKADMNAGAPSVLVAYGTENVAKLESVRHLGQFIRLWRDATWKSPMKQSKGTAI